MAGPGGSTGGSGMNNENLGKENTSWSTHSHVNVAGVAGYTGYPGVGHCPPMTGYGYGYGHGYAHDNAQAHGHGHVQGHGCVPAPVYPTVKPGFGAELVLFILLVIIIRCFHY